MNSYYINAIILNGCSYSLNPQQLLESNNINHKIINVDHSNKNNFKTDKISSFPQIYLKHKNKNGSILLGGYTELNNFINDFKNSKYDINKINNFINKNNWNKKATLRLIELINS